MKVEDLYFAPEDLFRLGNSTSPRLTNVRRPKDIDTAELNGILMVISNGKGISLSTKERIDMTPMSGWVWKITKGTPVPQGLKLINDREGHYSICPVANMPLDEFKGLLSKLALRCQKVFKKAGGVMATIRQIEISAIDSEARIILESLHREMERLKAINANSGDEDEAADAGNDYLEVSSLFDKVKDVAVPTFGEQIANFSNEHI